MDHREDEKQIPVRGHNHEFCWVCGLILASDVEKRIGTHIRCVHNENRRAANAIDLKVPSYGARK